MRLLLFTSSMRSRTLPQSNVVVLFFCILSLVLFRHADAVFVSATSFFVSMAPAFVFMLLFLLLCHRQVCGQNWESSR